MMGARRTTAPLCLLACCALLFLGRLFQIQVLAHARWSEQAARLQHAGAVLPYRRGAILDASGRVLVRDREAYHLVFTYRSFRRGHPLGQVAHARAALLGRPVDLFSVWDELEVLGRELVSISPAELERFAAGEPAELAGQALPAGEPREERRSTRAADLHYYLLGLLGLTGSERLALARARRAGEEQRSYATLVAAERGWDDDSLVLYELDDRISAARDALVRLSNELALARQEPVGATALLALLEELDGRRVEVERRAASRLLSEVLGFASGRVESAALGEAIDLGWLERLMCWDEPTRAAWLAAERARWLGWRDSFLLPYLMADLDLPTLERSGPDAVLDRVLALFLPPQARAAALDGLPSSWRRLRSLDVVPELTRRLRADLPRGWELAQHVRMPVFDARLRALEPEPRNALALLELARSGAPIEAGALDQVVLPDDIGLRWVAARARELADDWEDAFQEGIAQTLVTLAGEARPDELSEEGRLLVEADYLDQVGARLRYLLIDHGSRPHVLEEHPAYEVVYLLTRFAERFPGFEARDAREREEVVLLDEPGLPGARLVGSVLGADPDDLRHQRVDMRRLGELSRTPQRNTFEQREFEELLAVVRLTDELRGATGVEAYWDPYLRGTNGYREELGLEDVHGRGSQQSVRPPEDGFDVQLTMRAEVQLACERILFDPRQPYEDELRDPGWYRSPVGAIVLLTPDGDLVASASGPPDWAPPGSAGDKRSERRERSLDAPGFQPPGSVFKPFVAAYALSERSDYDPGHMVPCVRSSDEPANYGNVRCWNTSGHGPEVDLRAGVLGSCNSYFAHMGEMLSEQEFLSLAHTFGFGEPTGIQQLDGRRGFREESFPLLFQNPRQPVSGIALRRAANGLQVVEATPLQVARGFCALATGVLPEVRLVASVGGEPFERARARRVPYDAAALEVVREHLEGVANEPSGTAYEVLNETSVGYRLAVKTGSADLTSRNTDGSRGLKHTWVSGWLPADDPALVFTVFVDGTYATSSHGAVYLVEQVLKDAHVRAYLAERGVHASGGH